MNKRSTKFYRKNEEEVMKSLGLRPTKNSGAGFAEKEDGQSDFLICQLKSTDAKSISVKQQDIHTLDYNAAVSHKLPVFAIQFLNTGEVWIMAKPKDFCEIAKYIETGECATLQGSEPLIDESFNTDVNVKNIVKSSEKAREQFHKEKQKQFKKERKAW